MNNYVAAPSQIIIGRSLSILLTKNMGFAGVQERRGDEGGSFPFKAQRHPLSRTLNCAEGPESKGRTYLKGDPLVDGVAPQPVVVQLGDPAREVDGSHLGETEAVQHNSGLSL